MASVSTTASSSDLALLQSFPGSTSPSSAAHAISRAVSCSLHGTLPPETLAAARVALTALADTPAEGALPGLVDAVETGADSSCVDAFVLTAGAWRALLGLTALVRDTAFASRVLSAAAVSALAVLGNGTDTTGAPAVRRLRIARFHTANGARCARAFYAGGMRGGDGAPVAAAAALDLFGSVAERIAREEDANEGVRALAAPSAAFLTAALSILGTEGWGKAFRLPNRDGSGGSEVAPRRALAALYLARVARSAPPLDDFGSACAKTLRHTLIPFLFELIEMQAQSLLQCHPSPAGPSVLAMISAGIGNAAVQLDNEHSSDEDAMLNFLLVRVSSPVTLISSVSSRAVQALIAAREADSARKALAMAQEAMRLARALRSPHDDERWAPLCLVISQNLRTRGLETDVPDNFVAPCAAVRKALNTAVSSAQARSWLASDGKSRGEKLLDVHGGGVSAQLLALLGRSAAPAPSPHSPSPTLLSVLATGALDASERSSTLRRAAALQHFAILAGRLPPGQQRSALTARMNAARGRNIYTSRSIARPCDVLLRLREALGEFAKVASSLQGSEPFCKELESVICVAQNIKTVVCSSKPTASAP